MVGSWKTVDIKMGSGVQKGQSTGVNHYRTCQHLIVLFLSNQTTGCNITRLSWVVDWFVRLDERHGAVGFDHDPSLLCG